MKNVKLVLEYDGSKYFGFQRQSTLKSVQGELEKALSWVLKEKIEIAAAGRTDKGVHGKYQVVNFQTNTLIPIEKLAYIINKTLDDDIRIISSEEVSMDFHARFSAKGRKYLYLMKSRDKYNVFERNYITFIEDELNIEKFLKITEVLIGEHDFDSFRKSDCNSRVPVREIKEIQMEKDGDLYKFYIRADSFLKSMVRIIIGSALAVYFGAKENDYIIQKLKNPTLEDEKIVAPAQGLYLYDVEY